MYFLRRILILVGIVYIILNLFIIYLQIDEIKLNDEINFLNLNKCPYCYGMDICSEIIGNNSFSKYYITFNEPKNWFFFNSYFLQEIFNIKNIWFGIENFSGKELIFKKLAHNSELNSFDLIESVCLENKNNAEVCEASIAKLNISKLTEKLNENSLAEISKLLEVQCTECFPQRLIDKLYSGASQHSYLTQNIMLLTTLKINPEPIVLQLLSNKDDWPFPEWYGSCGRLIIESYEGLTLDFYLNHSFYVRAKIARKLLEALFRVYENEQEISVYLFDLSFQNVAYNLQKDRIYFIDLEHILIVDKFKLKKENLNWNESFYLLDYDDCNGKGGCLVYQVTDICKNFHVDINFYSACRHLLSLFAVDGDEKQNFLHSIPDEIEKKFHLNELLERCAYNKKNRIELARIIILVLEKIEKSYANHNL